MTALDDRLTRSIGRLSMTQALLLGVATYAGIGLALPLTLEAKLPVLVSCNIVGALSGWTITLAWLFPTVESRVRRHLLEWTTDLRRLSAQEFEWLVGEVLHREGWSVEETGQEAGPDGNVDLRIRRGASKMLVQCKRWESWPVGVDEIRKLAGTLMREGLPGRAGMFVTLSHFTEAAISEAEKVGMTMVDNRDLLRRIEQVRATEPCPNCATPMLVDRSARGWWLRCPSCPGKRDLGNDPCRALELLVVT